jgi:hypothetical protein
MCRLHCVAQAEWGTEEESFVLEWHSGWIDRLFCERLEELPGEIALAALVCCPQKRSVKIAKSTSLIYVPSPSHPNQKHSCVLFFSVSRHSGP